MPTTVVPESEARKTSLENARAACNFDIGRFGICFCGFLGGPTFEAYIAHPYPINVDVESKHIHRVNP